MPRWPLIIACVAVALACQTPVLSADPAPQPKGLMWNRTGLPAVFPLEIKSAPGRDYVVTLSQSSTGDDVLAAYVTGGEFFRVLVPPGRYDLRFDYGAAWQGADAGFGSGQDAGTYHLPDPLVFEVRGRGTKAGQFVDLTAIASDPTAEAQIREALNCQRLTYDRLPPFASGYTRFRARAETYGPYGARPTWSDLLERRDTPQTDREDRHYPSFRYNVTRRVCP